VAGGDESQRVLLLIGLTGGLWVLFAAGAPAPQPGRHAHQSTGNHIGVVHGGPHTVQRVLNAKVFVKATPSTVPLAVTV